MCPYVHPCKSSKEPCCLRKSKHARLQNNARHAKPEGCETMLRTWSKTPVEKCCNETYHVPGQGAPQKHGSTGLEAPDKINIFSSRVQWFFQPSQCFVNIATLKMATKCHEDGVQNTLSMVFAWVLPHHFQIFFFEKNCFYRQFFSSVANSWNKSLSTLFFLHTY